MPNTVLSAGDKQRVSLSFSGCEMEITPECPPGASYLCKEVHSTRVLPALPVPLRCLQTKLCVCVGAWTSHRDTHFWEALG